MPKMVMSSAVGVSESVLVPDNLMLIFVYLEYGLVFMLPHKFKVEV